MASYEGACRQVFHNSTHPPKSESPPHQTTETSEQLIVTATSKRTGPEKPEPKRKAAPKPVAGKSKNEVAAGAILWAAKPAPVSLEVPIQISTSPLAEISDIFEHLPLQDLQTRFVGFSRTSPPHRCSSPAGFSEDRYSVFGRIWQHAVGGRSGVKPCTSPA